MDTAEIQSQIVEVQKKFNGVNQVVINLLQCMYQGLEYCVLFIPKCGNKTTLTEKYGELYELLSNIQKNQIYEKFYTILDIFDEINNLVEKDINFEESKEEEKYMAFLTIKNSLYLLFRNHRESFHRLETHGAKLKELRERIEPPKRLINMNAKKDKERIAQTIIDTYGDNDIARELIKKL